MQTTPPAAPAPARDDRRPGAWRTRVSLEVVHAFHADPSRCGLRFEPTPDSAAWMDRAGAVARTQAHRWLLAMAEDAPRAGEAVDLALAVHATDPAFATYTEGLAPAGAPAPRADSIDARAPAAGAPPAWTLGPLVQQATVVHPQAPVRPAPAFVVTLRLAAGLADAGRCYRLELQPRSTVWKYVLLGDWAQEQPRVVDVDDAAAFEAAVPEPVAGGGPAWSIRSTAALPLQERSTRRFQLHGRARGYERKLVDRLPVAGPATPLALDTAGDAAVLVSEIYIQR